jgi:cell division protein FtsL
MYTQKKPIDNAHIVRERDRQRFRELLAVFALGVPIGLFLLLFTWQNLEVIRLGREATHLQTVRKQIDEENKRLQVELDRLTALESVQKRANELGFAKTEPTAIVMVSGSGGQAILPVPGRSGQAGLPVLQEDRR